MAKRVWPRRSRPTSGRGWRWPCQCQGRPLWCPPPGGKKRKAGDSESDEEDLASLTQAAYQPVDGCLTGKAATAMEAVLEMVVANAGAPAERKALLSSDKVEQDAEREVLKECRSLQIMHQAVTRQEWADKLGGLRVTWEAARVAQTMLEKLLRQVPQDTSQVVAVATATLETLVKQKTFELRGLEARMDIYMQAHKMMRTSGESIVTIDKSVSDREGEHVKKSASVLVREQQLAKIRKSATQKMQNAVVSIQLAHAKVGVFPGSVPGGMPSMGGMSMPQGPALFGPGFGGPPPTAQGAASALQPDLSPGGARMVALSHYVCAARVGAFDKNVLLVAQDEFPQATNMDSGKVSMQVTPVLTCKCCGLLGHSLECCGFPGTIPGELNLPQVLDLPGGWKILTPRQARAQRLVTKAHAKLPDKEVGVS